MRRARTAHFCDSDDNDLVVVFVFGRPNVRDGGHDVDDYRRRRAHLRDSADDSAYNHDVHHWLEQHDAHHHTE